MNFLFVFLLCSLFLAGPCRGVLIDPDQDENFQLIQTKVNSTLGGGKQLLSRRFLGIKWPKFNFKCTLSCGFFWICVVRTGSGCKPPSGCVCEKFAKGK